MVKALNIYDHEPYIFRQTDKRKLLSLSQKYTIPANTQVLDIKLQNNEVPVYTI